MAKSRIKQLSTVFTNFQDVVRDFTSFYLDVGSSWDLNMTNNGLVKTRPFVCKLQGCRPGNLV